MSHASPSPTLQIFQPQSQYEPLSGPDVNSGKTEHSLPSEARPSNLKGLCTSKRVFKVQKSMLFLIHIWRCFLTLLIILNVGITMTGM